MRSVTASICKQPHAACASVCHTCIHCSPSVRSTITLCYVICCAASGTHAESPAATAQQCTYTHYCYFVVTATDCRVGKGSGEVTAPMLSRSYQRVLSGLWATTSLNELSAKIQMWYVLQITNTMYTYIIAFPHDYQKCLLLALARDRVVDHGSTVQRGHLLQRL
jgi:hypothetical protein